MKIFFTLFFICYYLLQSNPIENKFEYEELFKMSKETGKPVILYFHNNNCSWCRHMEKTTLSDTVVYDYMKKNFYFFSINTDEQKYDKINERFKIDGGPYFLFLDSDGEIYHKFLGYKKSEEFMKILEDSKIETNTLSYYQKKYNAGNRDKDFLYNYCYKMDEAFDLDSALINEYLNILDDNELSEDKNLKFILDFAYYKNETTLPYNGKIFNFILNNWKEFEKVTTEEQALVRYINILKTQQKIAIRKNDYQTFLKYIKILKKYEREEPYLYKNSKGEGLFLLIIDFVEEYGKLSYYKQNDTINYLKYLDSCILKYWDDARRIRNFVYWKLKGSKKSEKQKELYIYKKFIERSIELDQYYYNTILYVEILYKLEDYEAASKALTEAYEIAQTENMENPYNYNYYSKLINKELNKPNNLVE